MPPRCKAPKCAEVANKCACPNPWVEFLSKNAHKGKTTMAEHSAAYKALKDSGAFTPKAGLNNGGCKSDPVKLCAWKLRRKAGHKDLITPVHGRDTRRAERILKRGVDAPSIIQAGSSGISTIYQEAGLEYKLIDEGSSVSGKELLDKYADTFDLKRKGVALSKILGSGEYGTVFAGTLKTATGTKHVAVKFLPSDVSDSEEISLEVHNHRMMYDALPHRVPKLYKAFKIKGKVSDEEGEVDKPKAHFPHVLVMEKVTPLKPILMGNDAKLQKHVCVDIRKMLLEMRDHKLVHGDFFIRNLAYKMVNGKLRVYLLDFESCWKTQRENVATDYEDLTKVPRFKKIMESLGGFPSGQVGEENGSEAYRKTIKLPKIPF